MVSSWPLQLSESWAKPLYLRSMLSNSMKVNVLVVHSCPTLWNPMKCSPPGSFVNRLHLQAKMQQIDKKHWKPQCLQLALVNRKGLTILHNTIVQPRVAQPILRNLKEEDDGSFASSTIFTWPLTNQLPLLRASQLLFAGKMLPQPAGGRKCFPRVLWIPKDRFKCYRNKQTVFSVQNYVACNGSYFD